jgi:hypothetical protein
MIQDAGPQPEEQQHAGRPAGPSSRRSGRLREQVQWRPARGRAGRKPGAGALPSAAAAGAGGGGLGLAHREIGDARSVSNFSDGAARSPATHRPNSEQRRPQPSRSAGVREQFTSRSISWPEAREPQAIAEVHPARWVTGAACRQEGRGGSGGSAADF